MWLTIILAFSLLIGEVSQATLFELDLDVPGDGLLTYDDATGLYWLDVGLTDGLSYNDVQDGIGNSWYADGWRHATTSEMCSLFSAYVTVIDPCPDIAATTMSDGADDYLLSFMDPNGGPEAILVLYGAFDDGPESAHVGDAGIGHSLTEYIVVQAPDGLSEDARSSGRGNFLVQVIPEPTTALLLACGLAGLAAAGRRRRS